MWTAPNPGLCLQGLNPEEWGSSGWDPAPFGCNFRLANQFWGFSIHSGWVWETGVVAAWRLQVGLEAAFSPLSLLITSVALLPDSFNFDLPPRFLLSFFPIPLFLVPN